MDHCCYILFSKQIDRYYTGITLEEPNERLRKHIEMHYEGQHYTGSSKDWELFLVIKCTCIEQAKLIEKHIKKMKSKIYIQNLKEFPEMIEKLREKYS